MKKILFLTGTRADFGKLKPLMYSVEKHPDFELQIFVTGMHTMALYGNTQLEVKKAFNNSVHVFYNQHTGEPMEDTLANTIKGLSRYLHENRPDMLVIHGDRVEALAGAVTGAINNILVAHIEGGERSGTIDELIRHSASKMSHLHFVSNDEARNRLLQMGEAPETVHIIGSPDYDVMLSSNLPDLKEVFRYYQLDFSRYGVLLYHPVTTRLETLSSDTSVLIDSLIESERNYVVIYPNNDEGSPIILDYYQVLLENPRFRIFPSMRFEYFLTLLRHADHIIGNSSAGVREAPFYGVPAINVGDRQNCRFIGEGVFNVPFNKAEILAAIESSQGIDSGNVTCEYFGSGQSADKFIQCLSNPRTWTIDTQKLFMDKEVLS
ncbi:UDP-N-acetyl-D-glucosamine 2-epimerase, UDP-hydrolysing [Hahella sp. CCB-MM4]|uniref:UDP-N-acetylglucosamine 2-epimerase n=1 Tax=Hahella sp. (strain CCB-MM4) TaxID=1926491 RepID=UPI000B9B8395|nr:UDP-N-acetylglucosamine 2-epimerase [Hahella sp. CCB-MM4]OZG74919.1 UDP-N-acetyl-D-glucosamine 2-epimerase, UDP-hydrolysing [Hahella sp. CCB-MM4]